MSIVSKDAYRRHDETHRIVYVPSIKGFASRLCDRKWEEAGSGYYSMCLTKGALCWKLSMRDSSSDGYIAYAQAIALGMMPASVHLPRIKLVVIDDEGHFAVLIERMERKVGGGIDSNGEEAGEDEAGDPMGHAVEASAWHAKGNEEYADISLFSLTKMFRFIKEAFEHSWCLDFHLGNVMYRPNGEVVITDPLSEMERGSDAWTLSNDAQMAAVH